MTKRKKLAVGIITAMVAIGGIFAYFQTRVGATTYTWLQETWTGGADTVNFPRHGVDQTDWTKYYSKDTQINTANDELKIAQTDTNWTETDDASGFSAGTKSNTYSSGTGILLKKNNGVACTTAVTTDYECTTGNCDADFSSGNYCHATASSCVNFALGTPWERANGYELCSGNNYYKSCSSSVWGSQQNCDTTNDYCDAGGGAQSGYDLAETCTSGATGGCNATSCTSCSPYIAASTSSCKTTCASSSDCWSGYECAGSACVLPCSASTTCGTSCPYKGDTYTTVQIGTQCWLAENLRTTLKPDGSGLTSYCNPSGCASPWGRLYDWNVAMNGATTATGCGAKIRGICPPGWHIPSDYTSCANDDFYLLSSYLGGDSVSGGAMKATGTTYWNSPNTGATNSSGFTGVGAGYWYSGSFYDRGNYGFFWSSFQFDATSAWYRDLNYNNATLYRYNFNKTFGISVRCVKD